MDVRITKMRLSNFKGIPSLVIDMDGEDVAVYGKNATGKTTLFDAFTWCLFGKDSADRSDFWVKPHDASGAEIHNLETEVRLELLVDERPVCFRHMVAENWVKKNGESERVYSGNTHSYWVNDVSRSSTEYTKMVAEIVSPEVFRLITNPMAFNAIDWKKRREFLLKLSPVDVDEILLARPEYQPIREAMAQHSTDVYGVKKVKAEAKKRDNTEMDQLPVRISEQTATMNALGECDVQAARLEIADIDRRIEQIDAQLRNGSGAAEQIRAMANAVSDAETKYQDAKMKMYYARATAHAKVNSELIGGVRLRYQKALRTRQELSDRIDRNEARTEKVRSDLDETRKQWYAVDGETVPEFNGSTVCPTCGQTLPTDQIEKAKAQFTEQFEYEKSRKLENIEKQGRDLAASLKELEETVGKDKAEVERLSKQIDEDEQKIVGLEAEVAALAGEPDYEKSEPLQELAAKVAEAKKAYAESTADTKLIDENLTQQKRDLVERKNELLKVEAKKQQIDVCATRISALEARQTELGIQIADTEQFLMLIDQFVTERCGLLEESINGLFQTVRWSLFEKQINGGMKDTCVCLIGGVQFSDANNAAKINAGLEIIEVLSMKYGVTVPVFIDNAEAVNRVRKIAAQQIELIVTREDEKLRVERMNEEVA